MEKQIKKILIAGGSGLIGSRLRQLLDKEAFEVKILTRRKVASSEGYRWNPFHDTIDSEAIRWADAVINLAGENLAAGRWTGRRKKGILNSRIQATRMLAKAIRNTPNNIRVFVQGSASGIYGHTGSLIIREEQPAANDFLGSVCSSWEHEVAGIPDAGIRTVIFRIGLVWSNRGGYLQKMRIPYRFGVAPVFGSGEQYLSWIHIDDLCRMLITAVTEPNYSGVYNASAPGPIMQLNFATLMANIIPYPQFRIHIPPWLIRFALGEMGVTLLTGTRMSTEKIREAGFKFCYPQADDALLDLIQKKSR